MATENIPVIDQKAQQKFEKIAIRRLIRKLDRRILTFMCLLEIASYINRVSIGKYLSLQSSILNYILLGHAQLMGIEAYLNLSQNESNWSISLFYLAYVRKLRYQSAIISNKSFVLADLCNSEHYFGTISRSNSLFVIQYDCMGCHHNWYGLRQKCS
jgi:hypothetical protein